MIPVFSGGNLRVRWHEWAGLREWIDCVEVSIAASFVVITTDEKVIVVPRHRIYGQLEVEERPVVESP